jgi:hypothetical protein
VQLAGQVPPAPSQAYGAHVGEPVARAGLGVHVPRVVAHVSHAPSQARSQQMPSLEHTPEMHAAVSAQDSPRFVLHAPSGLHVPDVPQESSSASRTGVHLPGVALHVSHVPLQLRSQQTPSVHAPDAHSMSAAQAVATALPNPSVRVFTRRLPSPALESARV